MLKVEPYANNWSELTQRLLGRSVSLWGELFQPTIMERIESVIQNHLDDGLVTMQQSIQQHCGKFDLKPWLWTETSSDLPSSVITTSKTSGKRFTISSESTATNDIFLVKRDIHEVTLFHSIHSTTVQPMGPQIISTTRRLDVLPKKRVIQQRKSLAIR